MLLIFLHSTSISVIIYTLISNFAIIFLLGIVIFNALCIINKTIFFLYNFFINLYEFHYHFLIQKDLGQYNNFQETPKACWNKLKKLFSIFLTSCYCNYKQKIYKFWHGTIYIFYKIYHKFVVTLKHGVRIWASQIR
jgi:hypothetical protein